MKYCLHHSGPHNTTPREDMSNKVGITHLFSGSPLRDLVISNIYAEGGQWLREAGGALFLPKGGGRFAV